LQFSYIRIKKRNEILAASLECSFGFIWVKYRGNGTGKFAMGKLDELIVEM
jgi:hypothetical protein